MTIKSIVVPVTGVPNDRQLLDFALAVAKQTGAHIRALFVRPDPRQLLAYTTPLDGDPWSLQRLADELEADGVAAGKRAHEAFVHWCAQSDLSETEKATGAARVTAGWCQEVGQPKATIGSIGGTADLVIMPGLGTEKAARDPAEIEAALFATGRPVLLVPPTPPADLLGSVIVAWNGSPEANRAVAAALPLLSKAGRVGVFCEPERTRAGAKPDALIAYLAWHGIKAAVVPASAANASMAEKLFDAAARVHASLLVMGAYTHSRVREMMFGGVTDHVLHHAVIPVLMAH
ncbi:MAG: universal stress protein [Alphaproteobacteria bacterium]|nr:universal stress protein [Alphaproteobacteria bacterium]